MARTLHSMSRNTVIVIATEMKRDFGTIPVEQNLVLALTHMTRLRNHLSQESASVNDLCSHAEGEEERLAVLDFLHE